MTDASCVGDVRRFCARTVEGWGWSEVDAGRLSLIATELGTNLVRHAVQGELWIAALPAAQEVEILALDKGPGMEDVQRSFQDGVSTGSGSPGTGLGAIRRLASGFDIHSTARGTVCVVRVRATGHAARPERQWGAVSVAAPGETVCGDGWAVAIDNGTVSAVLADGLGHGPHAAAAAEAALEVFAGDPFVPLDRLVQDVHTGLQTTRGAALFAMRIESSSRLEYAGAGNVMGRIISGVFDRSMVTQHGTVGVQVRKTEVARLVLPDHAVAVVHSDGIASRWKSEEVVPLLQRDPTLIAAALLWQQSRGRDDATVLVVKQGDTLE
ncbi:anti-sigma regulatory factor (Ser/Thr protein kinase) [Acidovorax sp. CF316]|uniref:ATP-binding protein n=1 Tax=Acidovorax sp. CF316 TaxID=1144317 RepID=UPI00026BE538|nr:ATP-binding protein [Acidovorax sp. CF316]EJE50992.1 anti-sigma regulatory factor (Ser/Thr protein kinase) [Acidovorax sp. CF316]